MDAYEIVGYEFYESADNIRKILRTINKSGQIAHNPSAKKQYLCTGFLSSQSSHDKIPKKAGASHNLLTRDDESYMDSIVHQSYLVNRQIVN